MEELKNYEEINNYDYNSEKVLIAVTLKKCIDQTMSTLNPEKFEKLCELSQIMEICKKMQKRRLV